MKTPKVSVLIPAYNAEKYIEESIDSILNQTFQDFEIIAVDDGSSDSTYDILEKIKSRDSRIIIFKNISNKGISYTRNRLKSLAKGEYIMWQDADDISMNYRMEEQVKILDDNYKIGIVGGYLKFFNQESDLDIRKYEANDSTLRRNIFRYSPVSQGGSMVRKSVFDEVGDYDIFYSSGEDLDMTFRIGQKYQFANVQNIVLKYRQNQLGSTISGLRKMELNTISIRLKYSQCEGYNMSLSDHIYNILQYISIFIIPPKLKITIFNLIRNTKK